MISSIDIPTMFDNPIKNDQTDNNGIFCRFMRKKFKCLMLLFVILILLLETLKLGLSRIDSDTINMLIAMFKQSKLQNSTLILLNNITLDNF